MVSGRGMIVRRWRYYDFFDKDKFPQSFRTPFCPFCSSHATMTGTAGEALAAVSSTFRHYRIAAGQPVDDCMSAVPCSPSTMVKSLRSSKVLLFFFLCSGRSLFCAAGLVFIDCLAATGIASSSLLIKLRRTPQCIRMARTTSRRTRLSSKKMSRASELC